MSACQRTEEASSSFRPKNWIWSTFLSVSDQRYTVSPSHLSETGARVGSHRPL
jgi:hypothetical protein